jgi:uncharacterized radical SAM superfamily Fe-S cluster-containing enzyme
VIVQTNLWWNLDDSTADRPSLRMAIADLPPRQCQSVRLSTPTIDPVATSDSPSCALAGARHKMMATGQWNAAQLMGWRWPIGCVALEITQRCNLDCTACYLSENSEAVHDLPLEEVFHRIDMIYGNYGLDTDVQVTGGDPTLRRRSELIEIVRRIRDKGMRPTLFTNGIRAIYCARWPTPALWTLPFTST